MNDKVSFLLFISKIMLCISIVRYWCLVKHTLAVPILVLFAPYCLKKYLRNYGYAHIFCVVWNKNNCDFYSTAYLTKH